MEKHELINFFKEHEKENLKFDEIKNKKSNRRDLQAFIILDEKFPSRQNIIENAMHHDEIGLNITFDQLCELDENTLLDLIRCGVLLDEEYESLKMYV